MWRFLNVAEEASSEMRWIGSGILSNPYGVNKAYWAFYPRVALRLTLRGCSNPEALISNAFGVLLRPLLRKSDRSRESKPLASGMGFRPASFVQAQPRFWERCGGKMGRAGRSRTLGGCRCHGFCWMLRENDRSVFPGKNPASGAGVGVDETRGDARFAHLPRGRVRPGVILPRFQRSIGCLRRMNGSN